MENGVSRPKGPTCTKCRNHGKPNVPLKKHRSVCPYRHHGMECDKGCALIAARHKINEDMKRALLGEHPRKRHHSRIAKKRKEEAQGDNNGGNNLEEVVDMAKFKKSRKISDSTTPYDSYQHEQQQQQQQVPTQTYSVAPMPQPSLPCCCLRPYQTALSPYMGSQQLYQCPTAMPWAYPDPGLLAWPQYQDAPYQAPSPALYQSPPSHNMSGLADIPSHRPASERDGLLKFQQ